VDVVKWNVKSLDSLTRGIYPKVLHLVFGGTMTGKTTVAAYWPIVQIAIQKGLEEKDAFFVVDTDGGFDFVRFQQIVENNGLDFEKVRKHLQYFEVVDFENQHELITRKLPELVRKNFKPLLISVDPISAIYRGIILRTDMKYRASVISHYTGKLDLQAVTLRKLAVEYDCPAFMTTWPVSPVGDAFRKDSSTLPEVEFIGGRQFGFLPKCILKLEVPKEKQVTEEGIEVEVPKLASETNRRMMILYKHKFLPTGGRAEFKLTDRGIED
jgi:RecA/RadA recombinase